MESPRIDERSKMDAIRTPRNARIAKWASQVVAAAILAMAIPPKFLGDAGAVMIFEKLGAEPFGRLATGGFELLAVLLLLIPRTAVYGGFLTAGLMTGAILSHLTVLGIALDGDPSMFVMAWIAFGAASSTLYLRRCEIPVVNQFLGRCELPDAAS